MAVAAAGVVDAMEEDVYALEYPPDTGSGGIKTEATVGQPHHMAGEAGQASSAGGVREGEDSSAHTAASAGAGHESRHAHRHHHDSKAPVLVGSSSAPPAAAAAAVAARGAGQAHAGHAGGAEEGEHEHIDVVGDGD